MNIPIYFITFLPKAIQDRYIEKQWNNKPDEDIHAAYKDAMDWITLSKGSLGSSCETILDVATDCQNRLDRWILPQVKKRNLEV